MAIARRWMLAIVVLSFGLSMTLGALGLGAVLIVEGLSQASTTFAALGVVLVVVAVLSSGAGAWKLSGVGFEISHQSSAIVKSNEEGTRQEKSEAASQEKAGPLELGPASDTDDFDSLFSAEDKVADREPRERQEPRDRDWGDA